MKLKVLALFILAVLFLVASATYSHYRALRLINTYEACVKAKGSVIQESYPSTCVTSLGARFPEPITPIDTNPGVISGPILTTPVKNTLIESPTLVIGFAPPGWMYEGVMSIKLVDAQGNILVSTQAQENSPGTWQSGNPVGFSANLVFTPTTESGKIIISKDNPSGLLENDAHYEFPVKLTN